MPTQEPPDSKLADLGKDGKPVENRLANAWHAWKICQRFVRDDKTRAARRQKVQGDFDGNAPKAKADLVKANRATDSNLNFKRNRGQIMNAWTPFFDMRCEVPVCIDGNLEAGDPSQNAALMRGFAQFFHEMLFGWRGFDDLVQLTDLQMLLHGPGVAAWENELDWRPVPVLAGNFYLPDETSGSMDNGEMAMIYTPKSAGALWKMIKDGADKAPGWNEKAVQRAIMSSARNSSTLRNSDWQRWQQAFKNGDQYVTNEETNIVPLYTLFVQEMDGTISEKILPAKEQGKDEMEYLFECPSRYDDWDQCLTLFLYDIGADGTYHSIKGLGTDIHPFCALLNSIDNNIADLVTSGIKPMWQPTTNAKMEDFRMGKWGGGNFVPNGIAPLQVDITRGIQPALEVSRGFTETLNQNTAAANFDIAAPVVEETAKAAMIRASERAKVSKGLHNRYMRSATRQYREMWRRASNPELKPYHPGGKEALKFQAKCKRLCKKLGVPWEHKLSAEDSPTGKAGTFTVLQLVENVRANRSLGLGSAAMRIEIVSQLMDHIDRFDEIGQNEILRAFTSVMMSYDNVDNIVPSLSTGRDPSNDEAVAASENNAMTILGAEAETPVVARQDHVLHLQTHLPSAEKDMEECIQGLIDPRECQKRLEAKGKHAQQHLTILETNPTRKQEAQEFSARLAEVAAYQDHLDQTIKEQDQAAAKEPQPGTPDPAMTKVILDDQRKNAKQAGDEERKAQKMDFEQALKVQAQQFEQALKAQEAEFDRRIDALETASTVTNERVKTEAKTEKTNGA